MVSVQVCIGSACHIGGSHDVIAALKRLIAENELVGKVELKAVFCMGDCGGSVCTRVNGEKICGVRPENIADFFKEHVLPAVE